MADIPERRLVLEVGGGVQPWPATVDPDRRLLGPNEDYVCVDTFDGSDALRDKVHADLQAYRSVLGLPVGEWRAERASAANLPFSDKSVYEVVAINFFGDRRTRIIHRQVVREIGRVLLDEGRVTVVETYSHDMPLTALCSLMRKQNLIQVSSGNERDPRRIGYYAAAPHTSDAYMAEFVFSAAPAGSKGNVAAADQANTIDRRPASSRPLDVTVGASVHGVITEVRKAVSELDESLQMAGEATDKLTDACSLLAGLTSDSEHSVVAGAAIGLHRVEGFRQAVGTAQAYILGYVASIGGYEQAA